MGTEPLSADDLWHSRAEQGHPEPRPLRALSPNISLADDQSLQPKRSASPGGGLGVVLKQMRESVTLRVWPCLPSPSASAILCIGGCRSQRAETRQSVLKRV